MTNLFAALLSLALAGPAFAGVSSSYLHVKSPLRYQVQRYSFSITASVTGAVVGVVPPGGAVLKDVVVTQVTAGEGGTSWVAIPKIGTDQLTTTDGGFTLAAGDGLVTNVSGSKMATLTAPAGATRPTITAANATQSGGQVVLIDVTLTGVYTTAVVGIVELYWEPKY